MHARDEKVLVVRSVQPRGQLRAVFARLSDGDGTRGKHSGELHLKLDGAVHVQVVEESVLIVCDGAHEGNDKPPRASGGGVVRAPVGVLPQNAMVLLVHAHRVLNCLHFAVEVGEVCVEVANFSQAIASELQRVGVFAQPVLPSVEGVLAEVRVGGVSIGHYHLREAQAVSHHAHGEFVLVEDGQGVEHQSLARGEADAETPVVPRHRGAVHYERRALRLCDVQRL
mmetsp:Transcript_48273/g.92310  ORF Transcript_48273/g.92310 Transcript_48273/m.92310 type:complete len:226 (-) Transcript_48273:275-952(-)